MCAPGTRGARPLGSPAQALHLLALGLGDVKKLLSMDSCPCALAPEDYEGGGASARLGSLQEGTFSGLGCSLKAPDTPSSCPLRGLRQPPSPPCEYRSAPCAARPAACHEEGSPHTQISKLTSHALGVPVFQLGKSSFLGHHCMNLR